MIPLRGRAEVHEFGGHQSRVVSTERANRSQELAALEFFKVANDAAWGLRALELGTVMLGLSTSVPREENRWADLKARVARSTSASPQLLFSNESLGMELLGLRGRLPFRGFTPLPRTPRKTEWLVVLDGSLELQFGNKSKGERLQLPAGSLYELPKGRPRRLGASRGQSTLALLLSPGRVFLAEGEVEPGGTRTFTPFAAN